MTIRGGEKATSRVWEDADGLEWTLPSPAPLHSFHHPPPFPPQYSESGEAHHGGGSHAHD